MPGIPGKRARARQAPKNKKRSKRGSGNPAKRAAEERAAAARKAGEAPPESDASSFELPKELKDLL